MNEAPRSGGLFSGLKAQGEINRQEELFRGPEQISRSGGKFRERGEAGGATPIPFRGSWDWQSEMNRMFDEMLGDLARSLRRQFGGAVGRAPAIDAIFEDGNLLIRASCPG